MIRRNKHGKEKKYHNDGIEQVDLKDSSKNSYIMKNVVFVEELIERSGSKLH